MTHRQMAAGTDNCSGWRLRLNPRGLRADVHFTAGWLGTVPPEQLSAASAPQNSAASAPQNSAAAAPQNSAASALQNSAAAAPQNSAASALQNSAASAAQTLSTGVPAFRRTPKQ